ncbi:XapX domain protein [Desulfotomaculum nigrificans CO-1-SRB]|uniref:XapX domain protein n=1 Tax=Desulfotomaculum nigrificans (strain DSM 14880 / VKM B-2319 / CO-1-SRB) TaxID=868595 RepID=F6B656_DESCC|nr:DUF1427 family protein [Desulfotomaculum nigrificans]AEF95479.1 XapX domain protein [Desulfotomaculum nigrificans CO-1-SRB]
MKDVLLSTITGFTVGLLFAKLRLPVPAPSALPGVMGIVGIFLGYVLAQRLGWGR